MADARFMAQLVEDMSDEPWYRPLIGGLGIYSPARQYNTPAGPITGGLIFQRCLRSASCKSAVSKMIRIQQCMCQHRICEPIDRIIASLCAGLNTAAAHCPGRVR